MEKAFRGTCKVCFDHFIDTKGRVNAVRAISDFSGIQRPTIGRWVRVGVLPKGSFLLRLRFSLESAGYDVEELLALPGPVRDLARLIALGRTSEEEVGRELGIVIGSVYRILVHGGNTQEDRMAKIEEIVERLTLPTTKMTVVVEEDAPKDSVWPEGSQEQIIESVAHQAAALLPVVKLVLSDEFTPEQRKEIRRLAGQSVVFKLSNALDRLCGETARREMSPPVNSVRSKGV